MAPLTGVWGDWEQATAGDMQAFLQRWQNSSLDLLQMGHAALLQLVMLAWYGQAEAWGHWLPRPAADLNRPST